MTEERKNLEQLKTLFASAKNHDQTAFDEIYHIYYSPVFQYIYYRTKNKSETEDITQEVFIKFYKNLQNFEVTGEPLRYFFTIARNSVIDWQRKKKPFYTDEIENNPDDSENKKIETDFLSQKILNTLRLLPTDQQDALVLRIIQGYTNQEIGKILGKSEDNIRQLQSRAIKKIRSYMVNYKMP